MLWDGRWHETSPPQDTGFWVLAWNRSPIEAPEGVTLVESPRAVGERTEVAFMMVSAADAVEEVLFDESG